MYLMSQSIALDSISMSISRMKRLIVSGLLNPIYLFFFFFVKEVCLCIELIDQYYKLNMCQKVFPN